MLKVWDYRPKKSELSFLDTVSLEGQIHEMDIFLEGLTF
jgi:hypothetical protein